MLLKLRNQVMVTIYSLECANYMWETKREGS